MPKQNLSAQTTPIAVARMVRRLGENIAFARTRRGLRQSDLATKTGLALGTVRRVESGSPTTAVSAYFTVLWALGLERELDRLAAPETDAEGITLERAHAPRRVRVPDSLDADF